MTRDKDWEKFEDYIADKLKEIDPYARASKGSGNKGEKPDIKTTCGLAIECKQKSVKHVSINTEIWKKLLSEIPLHVSRIPVLALENKDKKRWVALDLDDFLDLYIEYHQLKYGEQSV